MSDIVTLHFRQRHAQPFAQPAVSSQRPSGGNIRIALHVCRTENVLCGDREVASPTPPQSVVRMLCLQGFLKRLMYPSFCPEDGPPLLYKFIFKSSLGVRSLKG